MQTPGYYEGRAEALYELEIAFARSSVSPSSGGT